MNRSRTLRLGYLSVALAITALFVGCGSSSSTVTPQPTLSRIVVSPVNPSIVAGTSQTFTAAGIYSDSSQKDVTSQATWTSGTTSVATIGTAANPQPVNGVAAGTSTITAQIGNISGNTLLTVTGVSLSVSPRNAAVVVTTQTQQFSANVSGDPNNLGATWSVDTIPNGDPSIGTISSSGLYTPPSTPGNHTVTATSVADTSKTASAGVAVTDLAGITTYHYDQARDGANSHEFSLTPVNVNQNTFGKLFSCAVDGAVYAEPLWLRALNVNGATRNVILVATQHDTLFAFDADANPCQQLWKVNLLDGAHGGNPGDTTVIDTATQHNVGFGDLDTTPEIGVTGTPAIDPNTDTLYVVSKSQNTTSGSLLFNQRLHAIDLATGSETFSGPENIAATVSGSGDGSSGGNISFDLQTQNQRPGLALTGGVVYIGWAAHEDAGPYHGWLLGYNSANLQQQAAVFNTTPNASPSEGGIWMSGGAPAIDSKGNLYFSTGNGTFDANQTSAPNNDYGDTLLKMSTAPLAVADYFTPDNQFTLLQQDLDLSAGGVVLLPDQPAGSPFTHLLITGGKNGMIFVVNRDSLGGYSTTSNLVVQSFHADNGLFGTPAFWQNTLYLAGALQGQADNLKILNFNPVSGMLSTSPASQSATTFAFPALTPVVSANGASNGIVWAVDTHCYGVPSPCGSTAGPAVIYAYDATNLATELWDSSQAANNRDQAGAAVKFAVPTVANGKVYLGTRTEVDVYGLLP